MTIDEARRRKTLARWHRRLALLVGLWLALLALSGVLINHAHDWGLDRDPLPRALLGLVYGIEADAIDYCDLAESIGPACSEVFARLELPAGQLLLGATQLVLVDVQGRVIETLPAGQLGLTGVERGLRLGDTVYLSDGPTTVRTDSDLLDLENLDAVEAEALADAPWQRRGNPADTVTWERLLLDLHAARFLGPAARWFNDLMAGLILVLVVSGAWLYRAKRRRD
mgnify:CR=1 FL=1